VFEFNPNDSSLKKENPIIIFDDVLTTGSTIKEAAKILKENGFRIVWGLTIAS
jgi:competence protein ComFC